jgi:hypothetical protein
VSEPDIIQGRRIGPLELQQILQWLADFPQWSRYRLSRHVAEQWDWRNPTGQLKDMATRTLLLKLAERGWIVLPARRRPSPNRMRHKRRPALARAQTESPVTEPLARLQPLTIREVSAPEQAAGRELFESFLHHHHYLSYRSPVGENLQYLVSDPAGRPLACVLLGAAAWHCADRDRYIGWDATTRAQRLALLANNSRFLIFPWVQVPHLASHLWSRLTRRISADWQRKYGHPIFLLETFVQQDRFTGASYRAANWVRVGQTQGRTRQDRADGSHHQVPIKDIYLYPLHRRFRQRLQGLTANTNTNTNTDAPAP